MLPVPGECDEDQVAVSHLEIEIYNLRSFMFQDGKKMNVFVISVNPYCRLKVGVGTKKILS